MARALQWVRSAAAGQPEQPGQPVQPKPQANDAADAIELAAALCRRFEGLYLRPYMCPAGVATIGYGATFYEDGTRVTLSDPPITKARAEALLRFHLERHFLPDVARLCPGAKTQGLIGALLDLTFNIGARNLRASTLRRKVNAADLGAVPAQFRRWNKGGGRVLRGLTIRREAEIDLL